MYVPVYIHSTHELIDPHWCVPTTDLSSVEMLVAYQTLCGDTLHGKKNTSSIILPSPPLGGPDFSDSKLEKQQWLWRMVQY